MKKPLLTASLAAITLKASDGRIEIIAIKDVTGAAREKNGR